MFESQHIQNLYLHLIDFVHVGIGTQDIWFIKTFHFPLHTEIFLSSDLELSGEKMQTNKKRKNGIKNCIPNRLIEMGASFAACALGVSSAKLHDEDGFSNDTTHESNSAFTFLSMSIENNAKIPWWYLDHVRQLLRFHSLLNRWDPNPWTTIRTSRTIWYSILKRN